MMKFFHHRGFVIVIVLALMCLFMFVGAVIVNIGCGEMIQTKMRNDMTAAYYAAISGAEKMYAHLYHLDRLGTTSFSPGYTINASITNGTQAIPVSVHVYETTSSTPLLPELGIVSEATTPSGRKAKVTVKYGYLFTFTTGVPLVSHGNMTLTEHSHTGSGGHVYTSNITAEGPVLSGGDLTTNGDVTVTPSGSASGDQDISMPSFWVGTKFDTNNDTQYIDDANGDNIITSADFGVTDISGPAGVPDGHITALDIPADDPERAEKLAKLSIFEADDVYPRQTGSPTIAEGDDRVDDKDSFYYYYTSYYTQSANNPTGASLGLGPAETNYISGTKNYDAIFGNTLAQSKKIVFIDGDVNINYNAQQWWGYRRVWIFNIPDDSRYAQDLTVVAMGNAVLAQPTNGTNDRLSIVSYGNMATGGVNLSTLTSILGFGDSDANLNAYSHGSVTAILGGKTYGSIYAGENILVDTMFADADILNILDRDFRKPGYKGDWATYWPLGYPTREMGYPVIEGPFAIKTDTEQKSKWMRH